MKNATILCKKFLFVLIFLIGFLNANASDYYWVGGTGNWSDYGNHWATNSGGFVFHTTTPGPVDDVFFDGNSFLVLNDTVFIDSTLIYCRNMDWTGSQNNPIIISRIGKIIGRIAPITIAGKNTLSIFKLRTVLKYSQSLYQPATWFVYP